MESKEEETVGAAAPSDPRPGKQGVTVKQEEDQEEAKRVKQCPWRGKPRRDDAKQGSGDENQDEWALMGPVRVHTRIRQRDRATPDR